MNRRSAPASMVSESLRSPNAIPPRTSSTGLSNGFISPIKCVLRPVPEADWIAQGRKLHTTTTASSPPGPDPPSSIGNDVKHMNLVGREGENSIWTVRLHVQPPGEGRSEAADCGVQLVAEGAGREPQGHYKSRWNAPHGISAVSIPERVYVETLVQTFHLENLITPVADILSPYQASMTLKTPQYYAEAYQLRTASLEQRKQSIPPTMCTSVLSKKYKNLITPRPFSSTPKNF